ncbi:hypothetical protein GP486_001918 [Trichoglossum hirsutum]|uniref:Uncharacterized protein n=1 Tax=Trichoglossum hirsutum TaxID=265104 RepID=A0A9P8RS88_9PEZI|nr:hypothetical protein GP486_001918 [Trichoglossum hirsutum]
MDFDNSELACPLGLSLYGDNAFEMFRQFLKYVAKKDQMDLRKEPFDVDAVPYLVCEYANWKRANCRRHCRRQRRRQRRRSKMNIKTISKKRTTISDKWTTGNFKLEGLVKKTISVNVDHARYHLISYYKLEDVGKLETPSGSNRLRLVKPRLELIQSFQTRTESSIQTPGDCGTVSDLDQRLVPSSQSYQAPSSRSDLDTPAEIDSYMFTSTSHPPPQAQTPAEFGSFALYLPLLYLPLPWLLDTEETYLRGCLVEAEDWRNTFRGAATLYAQHPQ